MDESLKTLCQALKVVFAMLKPKTNPLAFVLAVGKLHQGKSTLLQHSGLTAYPIAGVEMALYYNEQGVVLELCESWLSQQHFLLSHVLKQLNRVHPAIRVSGLILCVDVQTFFHAEHDAAKLEAAKQTQWLKRLMEGLGYSVGVSVFLTKCDGLAGFLPFFQSDHASEWLKPLGFSIDGRLNSQLGVRHYRHQFDKLVEGLGRQVLPKLHAVRSSTLRTQIREFPLQLVSLRNALQSLVENAIKAGINLQGLFWMSAASHASPVDRLHHKFANDYGLMVQQKEASFRTHPAYFVQGAIEQVLEQNKQLRAHVPPSLQWVIGIAASLFITLMGGLGYEHFKTANLLDETSQELIAYELLIKSGQKPTAATYHLSQALRSLESIPFPMQRLNSVQKLQTVLQTQTNQTLEHRFLPDLLHTLEQQMRSPHSSPVEQYEALKTYLRLTSPEYFSKPAIQAWFDTYWKKFPPPSPQKAKSLLADALAHPLKQIQIDQALVRDVRNQLNALPEGYFYYSLAKSRVNSTPTTISIPGFVLAHTHLPAEYTKAGFLAEMKRLDEIGQALLHEGWVLDKQDITQLQPLLVQAYTFEYVTWWKQLMKQSHLSSVQNFQQAQLQAEKLYQGHAFEKLVQLIQENTSPAQGKYAAQFNDQIAAQFTSLHFLSGGALRGLNQSVHEMISFLATLAIVHDEGQTAFSFTKARFQGDTFSDSLSLLYQRANGLPQPVSEWVKGFADSIWSMLIQQARVHLNERWKKTVYEPYEVSIAHRYPFDPVQPQEVSLESFDRFFAPHGVLAHFVEEYVRPFIDTSTAQWKVKTRDGLLMPVSEDMMNELIRANVISNMFFPDGVTRGHIAFSLEKVALDPVVSHLGLTIGSTLLEDTQSSHSKVTFEWPAEHAQLKLDSIEGGHFDLSEEGVWAFFKMLQKVNVLVDPDDPATLQILFEVNGNAGRYILKTQNQINPFSPGILDGFNLNQAIV